MLYASFNFSLDIQVKSREPATLPIEGEWVIDKYIIINDKEMQKDSLSRYIGKSAHFTRDFILFDQEICNSPNYKIKRVDVESYFWESYKVKSNNIGISEKYVYIITVSSKDKYFDDYIRVNENLIIKKAEGALLFLEKKDDKVGNKEASTGSSLDYRQIANDKEKEVRSKSGALIALKSKVSSYGLQNNDYSYRTLWIAYSEGIFLPIMEVKDILLPRMNGFWKMGSDSSLWAHQIKSDSIDKDGNKNIKDGEGSSILFIGHDYVSVEDKAKKLQMLPIDNLSGEPIKLSKIYGQELGNSLLKGIGDLSASRVKSFDLNDTNFGVYRRGGRWILRGRSFDNEGKNKDFDIAYAAPKSLIMYDDLYPSFNNIKLAIPEAVDAYSSPNRDFVVVLTSDMLLVVQITNGHLGDIKGTLKLNQDEVVVMSHWATGFYVDEWTKKVHQ